MLIQMKNFLKHKKKLFFFIIFIIIICAPLIKSFIAKAQLYNILSQDVALEKASLPQKIDKNMNLIEIKQDRLHLTYIYQIHEYSADKIDTKSLNESYEKVRKKENCEFYKEWIPLGLIIDFIYIDKNKIYLTKNSINKDSCYI